MTNAVRPPQPAFLYNAQMQVTSFAARALAGAIVLVFIAWSTPLAQQPPAQPPQQPQQPTPPGGRPGGPPGGPGGAPPPRPIVPASASTIAAKPDAFYGQVVSIYAPVEQVLTPTAFSVDQDKTKSSEKVVVVVAPRMHEPVELNTYVTVIGEVVHADADEIAKKARPSTPPLPADVLARHAGQPVILATSVINGAFTDLARFIPPPMTPEEEAYDKTMKAVGAANGALRKGIEASNAELVKTNTAILAKAFADAEGFWKTRNKADAVKFAQTARGAVQAIETAAGMGNWNGAKEQSTTLGQQCQSCHGAYRERGEDGSYFIKPSVKGEKGA